MISQELEKLLEEDVSYDFSSEILLDLFLEKMKYVLDIQMNNSLKTNFKDKDFEETYNLFRDFVSNDLSIKQRVLLIETIKDQRTRLSN